MKSTSLSFLFIFCRTYFLQAQSGESVYLHTDKDNYLPGDAIWFKAYFMNNGMLASQHTNLYAAIYDQQGKLIQQKKYPIIDGNASGDFTIPDTLADNYLELAVFTKAQLRNGGDPKYFKRLRLYKKNYSPVASQQKDVSLDIFPEGGHFVSGVTNYLAFKSQFNENNPVSVRGIVKDNTGNVIDSFYTDQSGLGSLQVMPEAGKKYEAVWEFQSTQHSKPLPEAEQSGTAIHTQLVKNKLYYNINKTNNTPANQSLSLQITNGSMTLYSAKIAIKNDLQFTGSIAIDSFISGIADLKLLDDKNDLLQEKWLLIPDNEAQPKIDIVEKNLSAKGKNIIEITSNDSLLTNLSVSVTDINFVRDPASIYENLLMRNYSSNSAASIASALSKSDNQFADMLLLANSSKLKNSFTQKANVDSNFAKDNYLSLKARYTEANSLLPVKDSLNVIITDSIGGRNFYNAKSINQKDFNLDGLIFFDQAKVNYQMAAGKQLVKAIVVSASENMEVPVQISPVSTPLFQVENINENKSDAILSYVNPKTISFNKNVELKEVTVKGRYNNLQNKRILELDDRYSSGMFHGTARGYQVNVLDDENAEMSYDMCSYITRTFPMLTCAGGLAERTVVTRTGGMGMSVGLTPLLFVDEVQYTVPGDISSIQPGEVAYMKYIPGVVAGASFSTPNGVLYIYRRKGNEIPKASPNMGTAIIKGYNLPATFGIPDYSEKQSRLNKDYRSTLYWNPYLTTYKTNNKIRIEYVNSDISVKHLVVVNGINENGVIIHVEKIIE